MSKDTPSFPRHILYISLTMGMLKTRGSIGQSDNVYRLVVLLCLQLSLFYLQTACLQELEFESSWIGYCLFSVPTCLNGFYCGLGFFGVGHESAHRLYFSNRILNDVAGGICFAMVGVPFHGFRKFHMLHHKHTHVKGKDPKGVWSNYPFWFALFSSQIAPAWWYWNTLQYIVSMLSLFLSDACCIAAALGYYCILLPRVFGLPVSSCVIPFTLTQIPINILRAFTDHYGQPEANDNQYEGPGRIILTNDWFLEWLGCHANYHALHHRWPGLPHAHYKTMFERHRHLPWAVHDNGYGYLGVLWSASTQRGSYGDLK